MDVHQDVKDGEIVCANVSIYYEGKTIVIKDIIYKKNSEGTFYRQRIMDKYKIPKKCKVIKVDVISRHGFEVKSNSYTKAIKNDEKRNTITGAYE